MTYKINPKSGKPDNNAPVSDSSTDTFPGSLAEREARSFREDTTMHRGTVVAVANSDGSKVGMSLEDTMDALLWEMRALRAGMIDAGTCNEVGDGDYVGLLNQV